MLDYSLWAQLFLWLLLLIGLMFFLVILRSATTHLGRREKNEAPSERACSAKRDVAKPIQPAKRHLKIGGLVVTVCIMLIALMMLFSNEEATLLDSLILLTALMMGIVLFTIVLPVKLWQVRRKDSNVSSRRAHSTCSYVKTPIRMSKSFLWIGILGTVFFTVLVIAAVTLPHETVEWWIVLTFALFAALGPIIILAYFNDCTTLEEDHFTHRNVWRKTRKISYESIARYNVTPRGIIMYAGERKYVIDREDIVTSEDLREWATFLVWIEQRLGAHKREPRRK